MLQLHDLLILNLFYQVVQATHAFHPEELWILNMCRLGDSFREIGRSKEDHPKIIVFLVFVFLFFLSSFRLSHLLMNYLFKLVN